MNKITSPSRKGFTLVELLTVIAIIGILAALTIPAIGLGRRAAQKAGGRSDARSIATAYNAFSQSGSRVRNITNVGNVPALVATSVDQWAGILAKRAELNDAAVWFITTDPALAGDVNNIPKRVLDAAGDELDGDFVLISPKSWAVAVNVPTGAAATTTPIVWTRGLGTDGFWASDSPWGTDGGHIAFLDGHVVWYEDLEIDPLANNTGAGESTTVNIIDALGPATGTTPPAILEDSP